MPESVEWLNSPLPNIKHWYCSTPRLLVAWRVLHVLVHIIYQLCNLLAVIVGHFGAQVALLGVACGVPQNAHVSKLMGKNLGGVKVVVCCSLEPSSVNFFIFFLKLTERLERKKESLTSVGKQTGAQPAARLTPASPSTTCT